MQRNSSFQGEIPQTTDVILTRILFTILHNMIKLLPISGTNLKKHELTTLLSSWNRVLVEKPPFCGHSRISQHFMGSEGFIPVFTRTLHWSHLEPDQPSPYLRSILILPTHLLLGLPSGLLPSVFPTKILYSLLFSPCVLHSLLISSYLN
jgi:hypothetical protein